MEWFIYLLLYRIKNIYFERENSSPLLKPGQCRMLSMFCTVLSMFRAKQAVRDLGGLGLVLEQLAPQINVVYFIKLC